MSKGVVPQLSLGLEEPRPEPSSSQAKGEATLWEPQLRGEQPYTAARAGAASSSTTGEILLITLNTEAEAERNIQLSALE